MKVSRRSAVEPFHAMDVLAEATRRRSAGKPVISMAVGQPAYPAPAAALSAARQALEDGRIGYTEALGIRRGRMVLKVDRLGLSNGRPVVIGAHHLPLPRFAVAADVLGEETSITAALAACGLTDYRRKWSRITARLPTPEEADLLQQSRSRPVLVSESLNVDPDGQPVDWTQAIYAAGRVQLVVEP